MQKKYLLLFILILAIPSIAFFQTQKAMDRILATNPSSTRLTNSGATAFLDYATTTGSAVPTMAEYTGAIGTGLLKGVVQCDSQVAINQASAATTELVALTSGQKIYVCGYLINQIGAATAPTFKFVYGTGTACGTGTTEITGVISGSVTVGAPTNNNDAVGVGYLFSTPAGNAICITTTTTQAQRGYLAYTKF